MLGSVSEFGYHANLVDRFCSQQGTAAAWVRKPDLVEVLDPDVAVRGGGWMKLDPSTSSVEIYGGSTAYGRFDPEMVGALVDREPFFRDKQVVIK